MARHPDLDDSLDAHVERCRRDFEETASPLFAWEALGVVFAIRRRRLVQDFPDAFTELPEHLSRREKPSTSEDSGRDFFREAHSIVTGASRMSPTPEHLDALWRFYELPEWLAEYLESCGRRLIGVPMQVVDRKPKLRVDRGGIKLEIDMVHGRPEIAAEPGDGPGPAGLALGMTEGLAKSREHWGGPYDWHEALAGRIVDLAWGRGISLNRAVEELPRMVLGRSQALDVTKQARHWARKRMLQRVIEWTGDQPPDSEPLHRVFSRVCMERGRSLRK